MIRSRTGRAAIMFSAALGTTQCGEAPGHDVIVLGPGSDYAEDGVGSERFFGGAGSDQFAIGFSAPVGRDLIRRGPGSDGVSYFAPHSDGVINLMQDRVRDPSGLRAVVCSIENAESELGDDILIGNVAPNRLSASGGDDHVEGRGGDESSMEALAMISSTAGTGPTRAPKARPLSIAKPEVRQLMLAS